jgi:hypothetical protein
MIHPVINEFPQVLFHPLNIYVYCAPLVAGVAIMVVDQIVSVLSLVVIGIP